MKRKQWVIYFSGIFEHGYVRQYLYISPERNNTATPIANKAEALKLATKFRFKFVADFFCWLYNKNARFECTLREFKVVPDQN